MHLPSPEYQYKVLPFGLSLLPRVFTKVAEAALVPLREQGMRILNYLDDWLIQAQSPDQLCEHRDLVLSHLSQLGLRVNWEKSELSRCRGSLFSVWSWIQSIRRRASHRNVLIQCWTAWICSRAGRRHHWNSFRGSWGIWWLRRQSRS